jgi:hypothetical protein
MSARLDGPDTADELYLARFDQVGPYRPVMTGDIFQEVTIPGVGLDHEAAMVISHPCNMRAGARLRDRIQMIPIVNYQDVPLQQWTTGGHARVYPLKDLELLDGDACAARFDETGMVASGELSPEKRVLCLTERGVLLLLQRQIYAQSRAVIALATLEAAVAHVLAEAELLEEWNEELVPSRLTSVSEIGEALELEATEFEAFMSDEGRDMPLRAALLEQHRRANVRRIVRSEIKRRVGAE